MVLIFNNKASSNSSGNYRDIELMSHSKKIWVKVVEARLRNEVMICEKQYVFMSKRALQFALRMLMEKYREGQRELHYGFVDLEKASRETVVLHEKVCSGREVC